MDRSEFPATQGHLEALKDATGEVMRELRLTFEKQIGHNKSHLAALSRAVDGLRASRVAASRPAPVDIFFRAVTASVIAYASKSSDAQQLARQLYGERVALAVANPEMIFKAMTPLAQTSNPDWAGSLAGGETVAPLPEIAPQSVYAALWRRGLSLEFGPASAGFRLPSRTNPGHELAGGFIAEGDEIPVRKMTLVAGAVLPHKLGVISTFTSEMSRRSVLNFERLVRDAMSFDTQVAIDAALLGSDPATAVRPAGLLNGLTPLAATAGGGIVALSGDLSKLAEAIPYSSDLVYLMPLSEATRATILAPSLVGSFIVAPALASKTVVALDASDFAGIGGLPNFDVSEQTALHESDPPAPLSAGTSGASADTAAPVRSLYQTDCIGVRLLADVSWNMRRTGRITTISNVTW